MGGDVIDEIINENAKFVVRVRDEVWHRLIN
jgi:hypothetical protein